MGFLAIPLIAFAFIFLAVSALLTFIVWRRDREETRRIERMKADVADMMLLFQTMRDVVQQQKKLATDFNQEIETKVGGVKKILATALEKNEKLYDRQRGLERILEDTRIEVQRLQRELVKSANTRPRDDWEAPAPDPQPLESLPSTEPAPEEPEQPFLALPGDEAAPAAPAPDEAPRESPIVSGESAQPWHAMDLEALEDDTVIGDEDDDEADTTIAPADAQAARDAFRALLNMPEQSGGVPAPPPRNGANGGANASTREQVLEYARAGMGVADIARELGIGKGEVRLMLSLAQQKPPEG